MAVDADITLPSLEIEAGTGATAVLPLPLLVSAGSGTGATGNIELPSLTVEAFVYSGLENANLVFPSLIAEGITGAVASIEFPVLTLSGTAIGGAVANANLELPMLSINSISAADIISTSVLELPSLSLRGTSIHDVLADGSITLLGLLASGLTSLSAGEVIGYALNLQALGLSKYEGYEFNSLCVIGGKPFGASSTGLYLLEGSNDAGKMIDAKAKFPLSDFGNSNEKRVRSVYYGGNSDGRMRLSVSANEGTERRRDFTPKVTKGKMVVPVGRGAKGEYWQFEVSNTRGADFEMSSLECFLVILRRGGCSGC